MPAALFHYSITEIPDYTYARFQDLAGGDVRRAVWDDSEHLLRVLVNMPQGSASVSKRMAYSPLSEGGNAQSRLSLSFIAQAYTEDAMTNLPLLFEHGPLRRFYDLKRAASPILPWERMTAACDVVRREDAVDPLFTSEFNEKIPPYYYRISSFESNDGNDYLLLLSTLGNLSESAVVDICVEPTDISSEVTEHTRYLSRLQSINRTWDRDDDEWPLEISYFEERPSLRPRSKTLLKTLNHKDPLADDMLRASQRFHESLLEPSLSFHIRVFAERAATAHLIGSVVAESAFRDGSYRLFTSGRGDEVFEKALKSVQEVRVCVFPTHKHLFTDRDTGLYSGFRRLAHIAPVKELAGAFRLPVASGSSPCCIRKNTDPFPGDEKDLIILGYDQDPPSNGTGVRSWK